jgi:GNAT superfamily N-acetyltransferase
VLDELVELARASDLAYNGVADFGADDVQAWLTAPFTTPAEDGWLVRDPSGRLVAWAYLENQFGDRNEDGTMYVHPGADRAVIEPLVAVLVQRSGERAAQAKRADSKLILWCTRGETDLTEAVRAAGAVHARRFVRMERDLRDIDRTPVALPNGVTLQGVDGADEDALHAFHSVVAAAWGDSPSSRSAAYEAWIAHIEAAAHTPFDEWLMAAADGRPVGVLQTTDFAADDLGWVRNLAVRQEYRNRGIATALLSTVFQTFAAKGYTSAGLVVDIADGEPESLRLYESVGMTLMYDSDAWQLIVPAG